MRRGQTSEVDLFGVPHPNEAMRAIQRMIAQSTIDPQASDAM